MESEHQAEHSMLKKLALRMEQLRQEFTGKTAAGQDRIKKLELEIERIKQIKAENEKELQEMLSEKKNVESQLGT